VESVVPDGLNCTQDTRGPAKGRVCLEERPQHTYYLQAITHYGDEKIHYLPGIDHLNTKDAFRGLTLEEFVRSSLFQDEVWRAHYKLPDDVDIQDALSASAEESPSAERRAILDDKPDALNKFAWQTEQKQEGKVSNLRVTPDDDKIPLLDHYGDIPGAVTLPVCRSWYGEAISDINSDDHSNAPCLCDPPAQSLGRKWTHPTNWTRAYTKRFIKDSKLYEFSEYGDMCHDHHDCKETGEMWKDLLHLPQDEELPKKMKKAWGKCRDPKGHGHHEPKKQSSLEPTSPTATISRHPRPDGSNKDTAPAQVTSALMHGTVIQAHNDAGSDEISPTCTSSPNRTLYTTVVTVSVPTPTNPIPTTPFTVVLPAPTKAIPNTPFKSEIKTIYYPPETHTAYFPVQDIMGTGTEIEIQTVTPKEVHWFWYPPTAYPVAIWTTTYYVTTPTPTP
jgi:hypothetical protein